LIGRHNPTSRAQSGCAGRLALSPKLRERLEELSIPCPATGCTLWTGALTQKGYGDLLVERRHIRAHRAAWEAYRGPIPDGMHVLHKCDVPACINPDHLWLGTNVDNMADKMAKGRHSSNPNPKLNERAVAEIRASADPVKVLAARYGVADRTIYGVLNRDTWGSI
jgi:hypothetical protein